MGAHRTRIKVCGLTRPEDVAAAVAAGADAVGVIMADSPRRVAADRARTLFAAVPPLVTRVGVFLDAPLDQVRAAIWRSDARRWQDLVALSRVSYAVTVDEQSAGPDWIVTRARQFYEEGSLRREWIVRPGETRQLEASILGWRYDRLALAAALGVAAVLAVFIAAALIVR